MISSSSLMFLRVSVKNWCTVVSWYSSPGRSTVVGKLGWFGESGKCWVSRQKP